ncbi:hypothetical protein F2Q68_00045521, partial [Brassica cretica]
EQNFVIIDLWQVVEKNKEIEAIRRVDALQKVLKEVHYLFVMFHGSVRSLLDKETSGGLIISHLYPFITDYLNGKAQQYHHPISLLCHVSDLSVGKKLQLPSFRETLKERGTVQMLTSLEVQPRVPGHIYAREPACHRPLLDLPHRNFFSGSIDPLPSGNGNDAGRAIVNGELDVKHQVIENASARILKVYHVSGYRYLLVDNDMEVSRASPSGKVATLAKETLLAVNKLRETVDTEKSRTKQEKEMEICITRGKELYMALEKASDTLLDATESVQQQVKHAFCCYFK